MNTREFRTPRFIYFDLGNVLLHFDHAIACRRIAVQTGVSEERVHEAIFDSGLQWRYEAGELGSEEFVAGFVAAIGRPVDARGFLRSCSDVFELNAPIVPVVAHLRAAGYRLGVLSNTCEAHWEFVSRGRYTVLQRLFEIEILSFRLGSMKPETPIYQAAVAASGVDAQEIFFTDDRPENVAGALRAGLDATQFQGVQSLLKDLRDRGVTTNL